MRILIVKRDKIGDLLLTTSVLAHLRAALPHAELHLLANDYNAWVARDHPAIDRLWIYGRVRDGGKLRLGAAMAQLPLFWRLRSQRFQWAIAMNGEASPRAVRRALAAGAQCTIGYAGDASRYGQRFTHPLGQPPSGHELDRMGALLRPLDVSSPVRWPQTRYQVPAPDGAFVRQWLGHHALAPGGYVVLGLGARWPEKQPTVEQVLRWTQTWKTRWQVDTVLTWTPGARTDARYPGDDAIARPVLARGLAHIHPFEGAVAQVAALMHDARTTVIPDSGMMHMAAASPGGVLGLFARAGGRDDPQRWHPVGARAFWLQAPDTVACLAEEALLEAMAPLMAPLITPIRERGR